MAAQEMEAIQGGQLHGILFWMVLPTPLSSFPLSQPGAPCSKGAGEPDRVGGFRIVSRQPGRGLCGEPHPSVLPTPNPIPLLATARWDGECGFAPSSFGGP